MRSIIPRMEQPDPIAESTPPDGGETSPQGPEPPVPGQSSFLTKVKRAWGAWYVMVPLVFAIGLGTGYVMWGRTTPTASAAVEIPENVTRYDIPTEGDPAIGPEDAKITVVEFSDYQCPYCTKWYNEVFDRLLNEYPDEVRFVYRDFPLSSIHPEAVPAAIAAHCAGDQGAYWDFHRALFSQKYGLSPSAYEQYAGELGLDTAAFKECVSDGRHSDEVNADLSFGSELGITATPTFFINGIALVGAQPYEVFKQVIDLELAGKIPQN